MSSFRSRRRFRDSSFRMMSLRLLRLLLSLLRRFLTLRTSSQACSLQPLSQLYIPEILVDFWGILFGYE
nr:MAG TPA: hypothetical protein [Caudoviricetes sp.]